MLMAPHEHVFSSPEPTLKPQQFRPVTTKCQHKRGHTPFPSCISPAASYVPRMVAGTTNSAPSTQSSALSPLDRALLTRLYTLPSACLEQLFKSLEKAAIENAPTTLFDLTEWSTQDHIKPRIETRESQLAAALKRAVK